MIHLKNKKQKTKKTKKKKVELKVATYLWGPIDPIGTICIGKIPSPRIREYPRTTSKGRDENYTLKRGKQYLCRS